MAAKKYAIDFLMSDGTTQTIEFEVPDSNISLCILKDGTTPMEADLPMGGFKVTGLGTPTAEGDAVPMRYANQNFAPAGYGLGTSGTSVTDLNTALNCGFFAWGSDCANAPFDYGTGITINRFNGRCTQLLLNPWMSGCGQIVVRHFDGTEWLPDEWVNPPMVLGVEYRTTKRYLGKVVYTKAIEFGALPNATYKQISYADYGAMAISCTGVTSGGDIIPYQNNSGTGINVNAFKSYITVWTIEDRSSVTATMTVEYYKTTD